MTTPVNKAITTLVFILLAAATMTAQRSPEKSKATAGQPLPSGMTITPSAVPGAELQLLNPELPGMPNFRADHPLTSVLSPDGNTLLVLTSGFNLNDDENRKPVPALSNEYVFIYDVRSGPAHKEQVVQVPNSYAGLAWAPDGARFYVSGGKDDMVHVFVRKNTDWAEDAPIKFGHRTGQNAPTSSEGGSGLNDPMTAGLAVSPKGDRLLVADYENDTVSLVDLTGKTPIKELDLRPGKIDPAKKGVPGGEYPYWVVFRGDSKAYVSTLRDREIVALDLSDGLKVTARVHVKGEPGKMILDHAGKLLFAVEDNSDYVAIVDTERDRVLAEIKTTAPAGMLSTVPKGSNPTGLALSPDEKTLYVTNGGTNSVAVIRLDRDPDDSAVVGLIPTAWYPTSITVSSNGKTLYVTNAKSVPGPNPLGCPNHIGPAAPNTPNCALAQQYVWQLEHGGLTTMPAPSQQALRGLTQQVARNNHFPLAKEKRADKAATENMFAFLRQHIKHVIYIVKENRTYDQVLGDLEKGNGDPKLALFPDRTTPNHHQMARQFVDLDNFYASGEVSGVGWQWSTAARAIDMAERDIPILYADRGLSYDVDGANRGINVSATTPKERRTDTLVDPENQLPGMADVGAPDGPGDDDNGTGYLWDAALRAKLAIRNYGFYLDDGYYDDVPNGEKAVPLLHDPASSNTRVAFPIKVALKDVTDPYFRGFDQKFPDYWRYKEWEREFSEHEKSGNMPALEFVRLAHDHTGAFKEAIDGVNTPETELADNDYAVGLLVERVAHSRFADSTLIFSIEDDAQNGPDHVDAHRTVGFVVGAYVKQGAVVSQRYNTVAMLRTIEEVLGTKPLGINDSFQQPMTEVFSRSQKNWSYTAKIPEVLKTTQLPVGGSKTVSEADRPKHDAAYWADGSKGMDFSTEDKLDVDRFNRLLWEGLKGENVPYPEERSGEDLRANRKSLLQKQ